ncbi:MAG TPA: hypothetical protein VFP98_09965, partial [Candidatus Polarisedimenticolia bacterium]|nr:hypothetical protein [Candidatus Polarisedimenticolia bacterium]
MLPALGLAGRAFRIEPPREAGTRTTLFVLHVEGAAPLLLRLFRRRLRALRNAEALRHLESLGLPAPRLVHEDVSRASRLIGRDRSRPYLTVESWIDGLPHAALTEPAQIREGALAVAALLARFHEATRARWGRPAERRLRSFASHTFAAVRTMVADLGRRSWLAPDEAAGSMQRFTAWSDRVRALDRFNLVHNDANRRNMIVTRAGSGGPPAIVPVDLHRLAYQPFPEELVNALYHFCRKDPDLAVRFERAYFERAGRAARDQFDATRGFFEPLNYLKKMYHRAPGLPNPAPGAAFA